MSYCKKRNNYGVFHSHWNRCVKAAHRGNKSAQAAILAAHSAYTRGLSIVLHESGGEWRAEPITTADKRGEG